MSLPTRLYFPLDKAAQELGCDVSDLIHFAANGYVSLCYKSLSNPISESWLKLRIEPIVDEDALDLYVKDNIESDVSEVDLWYGFYNSYYTYGGKFKLFIDSGKVSKYSFELNHYMGLIKIGATDIYRGEELLLNEKDIDIGWLSTPEDDNDKVTGFFESNGSPEDLSLPFVLDSGEWQSNSIQVDYEEGEPPRININDLVITHYEIERLNKGRDKSFSESNKTVALKGEIVPPLIKMLAEFTDVDIDSLSVAKIKDIVESIAAEKGIEFPAVHRQTWQKYLGRSRLIK